VDRQKAVTVEQVAKALDAISDADIACQARHSRTLGYAEVLLHDALFGSADDWQRARQILIDHMEVTT